MVTFSARSCCICLVLLAYASPVIAQSSEDEWDVTAPRGQTREIDFTTDVGTWMSMDISPDGQWLVFDLLAHVYRVPVTGGEAQVLTQETGVALNFQPRYSPDGRQIAFISDRSGQNGLWMMDADGSNPRAVFTDPNIKVLEPVWTPDGQYIVAKHQGGSLGPFAASIWMHHRDGGPGVELVAGDAAGNTPGGWGPGWPSVSGDGRYVYFHIYGCEVQPFSGQDMLQGCYQLRRLELATGDITPVTAGTSLQQFRGSSGGGIAPEVSPDGRWLAFSRRIPDGTISYNGHRFGPRSALVLRDLRSGAERVVMDPIEVDLGGGIHTQKILPGHSWARDSESIVLSQGGKLRRLWVGSGEVETIPFTARVHRTISEQAYTTFLVSDDDFTARFLRWTTASPDGRRLVFQAVGKLWVMDLPNGTPRRLTPESFTPRELAPAWSPNGRSIVFTSWDEYEGGHVWMVSSTGGVPQRLTTTAGEYMNPVWAPDGLSLVMAQGSGASQRGRSWLHNPWYDLVRLSASGGETEAIARVNTFGNQQIVRATITSSGRVFYPDPISGQTHLRSVAADGSDKRTHLKLPFADEVTPSPDGRWIAFQEGANAYVMPFPTAGVGGDPPLVNKKQAQFPVKRISDEGGLYVRWRDSQTVEFVSGNRYFTYDVGSQTGDTVRVELTVSRDVPSGSVALTGARILTMKDRDVIDRGTVVVRGGRIACVGECSVGDVDRVFDVSGTTIVPGFIDMHAHHHTENTAVIAPHNFSSAVYLAYGVTTTLDPAPASIALFPTAELIEAGQVIGPRVFGTGENITQGDSPYRNDIDSYETAEHTVNRLASWGATAIKEYMQPRRIQRQWLDEAARKRGVIVTSEGSLDIEHKLSMAMDGHAGFEHVTGYIPLYRDFTKFLGQTNTVYSATLVVAGPGPWAEEYFWQQSELWKDEKQRSWLPWRHLIPHTRRRMLRPETDYSFPWLAQGVADIISEGGYGAIGSHGQQHGLGSHWEIWMTAEGTGPMGALEVATIHGAHFLGMEQDLGSLEVEKIADLLVLNANPLDNIRNTANIRLVMKAGRVWEARTLNELWPEDKAFGEHSWIDADMLTVSDRPIDYWDRRR